MYMLSSFHTSSYFIFFLCFTGRLKYLTLTEANRVWMPDLFFSNEKEGHFHNIIMPNVCLQGKQNMESVGMVACSLKPLQIEAIWFAAVLSDLHLLRTIQNGSYRFDANWIECVFKDKTKKRSVLNRTISCAGGNLNEHSTKDYLYS